MKNPSRFVQPFRKLQEALHSDNLWAWIAISAISKIIACWWACSAIGLWQFATSINEFEALFHRMDSQHSTLRVYFISIPIWINQWVFWIISSNPGIKAKLIFWKIWNKGHFEAELKTRHFWLESVSLFVCMSILDQILGIAILSECCKLETECWNYHTEKLLGMSGYIPVRASENNVLWFHETWYI